MTDKRFNCTNISSNGMTGLFWLGKDQLSVYDVLRVLNELADENEKLIKEIINLNDHIDFLNMFIERQGFKVKWEREE